MHAAPEVFSEPLLTTEQVSQLADTVEVTDDTPVVQALAMAPTAESVGISLSVTDIAIAIGEETPSKFDTAFQIVKGCVPFVRSRRQKLAKVRDAEIANAWNELEEGKVGLELEEWMGGLSTTELDRVEIVPKAYGDSYLSPLRLAVKDGEAERSFDLGDHLNYDWSNDGAFAALPAAARGHLADRQSFWAGLDVRNSAELRDLKEKYFKKVKVSFDEEERQPEIDWLEAKDATVPEADRIFPKLRALCEEHGQDMYLWVLTKVPPVGVEGVLRIAGTQEKFVSTWLPGFVKREKLPTILDSDTQAIQNVHEAAQRGYQDSLSGMSEFRRRYLLAEAEQQLEADLDFEGSLQNIERLRSLAIGLEIDGGCEDAESRDVMDRANQLLDMELSGEKIADRLTIDTVLYTTEGAKQILKFIPSLVGVAEGLQHVPVGFIKPLAKAVGAGDDLVGEASEISNLRAQGYRWSELRKRFSFVAGTAVAAVALGTQIENIGAVSPRAAAVAYAVTTFATTAATLTATMGSSVKGYERLAAQGKLVETPYLSSVERAMLHRDIVEAPSSEAAVQAVQQRMDALLSGGRAVDQKEVRKRIEAIKEAAHQGDAQQALGYVTPTRREALQATWQEIFRANPVRMGKLLSMPSMLGSAAILGGTLLSTPFAYVPFGTLESIGGLGWAKLADKTEDYHWRTKVQGHIAELKDVSRQSSSTHMSLRQPA